jgi:hypothetical protein
MAKIQQILAKKMPFSENLMENGRLVKMNGNYLFPFALLCVLHSIWQLAMLVAPPLLHAVTWSASISSSFHILVRVAS